MRGRQHGFVKLFTAVTAGLLLLLAFQTGETSAATAPIINGVQFTDTARRAVHAHDGNMIKAGPYYY